MFKILNGREHFYQWDINQKLLIEDASIVEVHFCNKTESESLVCEVYTEDGQRVANVPNILLQDNWDICVYAFCGDYTKHSERFKVVPRSKPADYVYTETELWSAEKAVAEALEAAKASGDFKGDKGDKGDAGSVEFKVVTELPESDDGSTMYLVPTGASGEDNAYDEFIYNNGAWEKIGSTSVEVNLDDYVKNTDYATNDKAGVIKSNKARCFIVDSKGIVSADTLRANEYSKTNTGAFIGVGTYENNKSQYVKEGITTNTETLTEEEKAAACEWLGAVKQYQQGGARRIYGVNRQGAQEQFLVADTVYAAHIDRVAMYMSDASSETSTEPSGALVTKTPVKDYQAANKKYVDEAINTALGVIENGTY